MAKTSVQPQSDQAVFVESEITEKIPEEFGTRLSKVVAGDSGVLKSSDFNLYEGKIKYNFRETGKGITAFWKPNNGGKPNWYFFVEEFCAAIGMEYEEQNGHAILFCGSGLGGITAGSDTVVLENGVFQSAGAAGYLNGRLAAELSALTAAAHIRGTFSALFGTLYHSDQKESARVGAFNGRMALQISGQPKAPVIYSGTEGSRSTWLPRIAENIGNFVRAGVDIIQNDMWLKYFWLPNGTLDMQTACDQIDGILEKNPEAFIMLRFNVSAPYWWTQASENAGELVSYTGFDGYAGDDDAGPSKRVSFASEKYRKASGEKLREFFTLLQYTPEGDRVIAVQVTGGNYGEFQYYGFSYEPDCGRCMTLAFRNFLKRKYGSPEALSRAWKTEIKRFEDAGVPSYNTRYANENGLRGPAASQPVFDYYACQGKVASSMVEDYCKTVKEVWNRDIACGVFYGYLFCEDNGGDFTISASASQTDLQSILESPYIDIISGPYAARDLKLSGCFRTLAMSVSLHGKLFITENDMPTHLGDGTRVPFPRGCRNERDSIAMLRRNYMYTLTENAGLWYYDFGPGNRSGEFNTPNLMKEVGSLKKLSDRSFTRSYESGADVLVVYDLYSCYFTLPIAADPLAFRLVDDFNQSMQQTGAAFDRIFLQDIGRVKLAQYKAVFFTNTLCFTQPELEFIKKEVMAQDRTVFFMSADGLYRSSGAAVGKSTDYISELTGLQVSEKQNGSRIRLTGALSGVVGEDGVRAFFEVAGQQADVQARYEDGSVAGVLKRTGDCNVWYFGAPMTDVNSLREILTSAGCRLYISGPNRAFSSVGGGYIGIYSPEGGTYEVLLRDGKRLPVQVPPVSTLILDALTGESVVTPIPD